jgi:tetratricopeptide (TPR) repeat protein
MTHDSIKIEGSGNIIGDGNINIGGNAEISINESKVDISISSDPVLSLHQLRPSLADFTGRSSEIKELVTTLQDNTHSKLCGIFGMGGIGKTELALFVANEIADNFPDAQLFIDMRGTDLNSRNSKSALIEIIQSFIGFSNPLPKDINQLSNIYRSLLHEKKALIVFDNVENREQIIPLIPNNDCAVIVTSRSALSLNGIRNIPLSQLSPEDSQELIRRISPRIESLQAKEICEMCGFLPLAIRGAGSLLAVTTDLEVADFINELRNERTRLEKLGNEGVDLSVKASINLSYSKLSEESAIVLRKLSVFPTSFNSESEEFICDDENHQHLSDLVRRSLVLYDTKTKRYQLHNLIRIFADSLLIQAEKTKTLENFIRYYLDVIRKANQLYLQSGDAHTQALTLFNNERENIDFGWETANSNSAANQQSAEICWNYLAQGSQILMNQLNPEQLFKWAERSLSIAKELKSEEAETNPLTVFGLVYQDIGQISISKSYFEKAICLAEKYNDYLNLAYLKDYLGRVFLDEGRTHDAMNLFIEAKNILCNLGEHAKEGRMIADIGLAHSKLGDTNNAIFCLEQVLKIAREDENRFEEANALANLATVWKIRSISNSIKYSEEATEIFEELKYSYWQARSLSQLGSYNVEVSESEKGLSQIQTAIILHQEIKDNLGESFSVGMLGNAYMDLEDYDNAIKAFDRQIKISKKTGNLLAESNALGNKCIVYKKLKDFDSAIATAKLALEIDKISGNLHNEFITLCHLGESYLESENHLEAIATFERQVGVTKTLKVGRDLNHAYKHLADAYLKHQGLDRSLKCLGESVEWCKTSSDPHDYPASILQTAEFLAANNKFEEAISKAELAIPLFEQVPDPSCATKTRNFIQDCRSKL